MSVFTYRSSFYSLQPRVREEGALVTASTPWVLRLLSLFSYHRTVQADAHQSTIRIDTNWLWGLLKRSRTFRRKQIAYLDFRFSSLPTGWSMWYGRTDQVEAYSVVLVLDDRTEFTLARFRGKGAIHTGWGGALLGGDSLVDGAGTQEEVSRAFADAVCERLGLSLGPTLPGGARVGLASGRGGGQGGANAAAAQVSAGPPWECPACQRPNAASKQSCMYCGAAAPGVSSVLGVSARGSQPTPQRIEEQPASAADAISRWNQKG